jgi:hypothetical protein
MLVAICTSLRHPGGEALLFSRRGYGSHTGPPFSVGSGSVIESAAAATMQESGPRSGRVSVSADVVCGGGEEPARVAVGAGENGCRLIIERAGEDEFDAWLGRARYERRPESERGLHDLGLGCAMCLRPGILQTAEGELEIEFPQVRQAAETFALKLFPRTPMLLRTEQVAAALNAGVERAQR